MVVGGICVWCLFVGGSLAVDGGRFACDVVDGVVGCFRGFVFDVAPFIGGSVFGLLEIPFTTW